jgi:hypothetical protein
MGSQAPPGWYPDPARAHQYRYFDGDAWTDHVSDNGVATQAPLGSTPPGLVGWHPPGVMVQSAYARPALPEIPRAKMWILAALSTFVFWFRSPGTTLVLPLGFIFAIWCWQVTKAPLRAHEAAGSSAVAEIKAARWVAVGLALLSATPALFLSR